MYFTKEKSVKFKRTDELLKDTELLKGAAASSWMHTFPWLKGNSNPNGILAIPQLLCQTREGCQNALGRLSSSEDGRAPRSKGIHSTISCKNLKRWLDTFDEMDIFPLLKFLGKYCEFSLLRG